MINQSFSLDYETKRMFNCTIVATDGGKLVMKISIHNLMLNIFFIMMYGKNSNKKYVYKNFDIVNVFNVSLQLFLVGFTRWNVFPSSP